MTAVTKTPLPEASRLPALWRRGDFLDGYATETSLAVQSAAAIALAMPGWARGLLRVRNALVRPFGLHVAPPSAPAIGLFPVVHETEAEMVLGFDDRHLDFRIGLVREGRLLYMGTWVRPHNLGGRAYLAAVMPFHVLITRNALARVARATAVASNHPAA